MDNLKCFLKLQMFMKKKMYSTRLLDLKADDVFQWEALNAPQDTFIILRKNFL